MPRFWQLLPRFYPIPDLRRYALPAAANRNHSSNPPLEGAGESSGAVEAVALDGVCVVVRASGKHGSDIPANGQSAQHERLGKVKGLYFICCGPLQ